MRRSACVGVVGGRADQRPRSAAGGSCLGVAVLLAASLSASSGHAQTVNYTYDALGRLTSAATVGGQTTTYSYDANGNRSQKVVGAGSGGGGGNTPPVANDDWIDLDVWPSGGSAGVYPTAIIDPLVNDTDADGDPLTITAVDGWLSGTVTFTGSTITYRHSQRVWPDGEQADLYDTVSFNYTISDGRGGTSTAGVTINIVVW